MYLGVCSDGQNGHDMVANRLPTCETRNVLFRPLTSAVRNLSKYLPSCLLNGSGLTIELESSEFTDSVITSSNIGGHTVDHSSNHEILDARVLIHETVLTSELQNEYSSLLLLGNSICIDLSNLSDNTVQSFAGKLSKIGSTACQTPLSSLLREQQPL